jgi:hypothetical protein
MFTFHDLEMKFGSPAAYHVLMEIEKAARIPSSQLMTLDPEVRLTNACRVQDAMMQQNLQMAA